MTGAQVWLATGLAVALAAAAVAVWIRWRYVAITVDGTSMIPALRPGDTVLVRRGRQGLRVGRIVVVARPDPMTGWTTHPPTGRRLDANSWFIKRVVAVGGEPYPRHVDRDGVVPPDHVVLLGDHAPSVDSKQFGPCPTSQILGVCVRDLQSRRVPATASSLRRRRLAHPTEPSKSMTE